MHGSRLNKRKKEYSHIWRALDIVHIVEKGVSKFKKSILKKDYEPRIKDKILTCSCQKAEKTKKNSHCDGNKGRSRWKKWKPS